MTRAGPRLSSDSEYGQSYRIREDPCLVRRVNRIPREIETTTKRTRYLSAKKLPDRDSPGSTGWSVSIDGTPFAYPRVYAIMRSFSQNSDCRLIVTLLDSY